MGDDSMGPIVMLVAVGVMGYLGYKFIIQNKQDLSPPAPPVSSPTTPPPAATTAQPVDINTIKPITQNQTIINNYKIDFDNEFGRGYKPSQDTVVLLGTFEPQRYLVDISYRNNIVVIINRLPSRERSFWLRTIKRLNDQLRDIDNDNRRRRGDGGGDNIDGSCVQHVMCMMNTHWDEKKCKCVPNTVPTPNITVDVDAFGQKKLVDGASSLYSRSTLVNNLGKINYY